MALPSVASPGESQRIQTPTAFPETRLPSSASGPPITLSLAPQTRITPFPEFGGAATAPPAASVPMKLHSTRTPVTVPPSTPPRATPSAKPRMFMPRRIDPEAPLAGTADAEWKRTPGLTMPLPSSTTR
jgi:hypothetical protein